jgi:hypothetical protein
MVDRKDEEEVDITIVEGPAPEPEKVTVPPEEPRDESRDDESSSDE